VSNLEAGGHSFEAMVHKACAFEEFLELQVQFVFYECAVLIEVLVVDVEET
jgi:hypothetical protein